MKKNIHPPYFPKAVVHCACGNKIVLGSTKEKIAIEICGKCHPFYTGKQQLIDTAGRVERFRARKAKAIPEKVAKKKTKNIKRAAKVKKK